MLIGFLPAWRGIPLAAVAALVSAKSAATATVQAAEAAAVAAAPTPGGPAARAAAETTKGAVAAQMSAMINAAGAMADKHMCATPLPVPPHGVGVVINGSPTVVINNLPACRQGDTVLEALGPPNNIAMGLPTVLIGP